MPAFRRLCVSRRSGAVCGTGRQSVLFGAEAADGLGVPLGVAERGGRILPAAGRDVLRPAAGRAHVGSPARATVAETGTKGLLADGMADVCARRGHLGHDRADGVGRPDVQLSGRGHLCHGGLRVL